MNLTQLKHTPNLATVIMVEKTLKQHSTTSIANLKKKLPKQVNHNTLKVILEYLEESNKIAVSLKGITWVHNNNSKLLSEIHDAPTL